MSAEDQELNDLEYTKSIRKQLVSHLTNRGEMPEETKQQMILLSALDGIDRAALGKMKIKSDAGASTAANAALMLAAIFNDPRVKSIGRVETSDREPPALDNSIKPLNLVEGELDEYSAGDSYEAFQLRHQSE